MNPGGVTVLVVDDEAMVRKIVTWVLKRHGYEVIQATDGEAGLSSFREREDIGLVLSDIVMPNLDGLGMVRELRQMRPSVPVLFMSGYTGHDKPALDDADLNLLLSKPFTADQLLARVERVLHLGGG